MVILVVVYIKIPYLLKYIDYRYFNFKPRPEEFILSKDCVTVIVGQINKWLIRYIKTSWTDGLHRPMVHYSCLYK